MYKGLGDVTGNFFQYQPSAGEVALAQMWTQQNGYGSVLTPWTLNTDTLSFTVPTTQGRGSVTFGFGAGVFANIPAPQGTVNPTATPVTQPAPGAPAGAAMPGQSWVMYVVLAGVGAWFFLKRRKRAR